MACGEWRDDGDWRDDDDGRWDATGSGWDTSGWDATGSGWDTSGWDAGCGSEVPYKDPLKRTAREAGNGYRPKANDPDGWDKGENRPSVAEYENYLTGGQSCNKKLRLMFKAFAQREGQKMATEDRESKLRRFVEQEQAKQEAAKALHEAELEHQAQSMEAVYSRDITALLSMAAPVPAEVIEVEKIKFVDRVVEKTVYVDVEVPADGADRPPPKFLAGQSVHQWWASWMAGAATAPTGISGKTGRPAWYSASVLSWEQFCLQACRDARVPGVAFCGE